MSFYHLLPQDTPPFPETDFGVTNICRMFTSEGFSLDGGLCPSLSYIRQLIGLDKNNPVQH